MTDKTRADFEIEVLKNKAAFHIRRVAGGEYQSGSTQEIWEYWQAATLAERGRCASLLEKLTAHRRMVRGAINGVKPEGCEYADAIRREGDT